MESKESEAGIVRRADFDDLDAIMDINETVYDGYDYMQDLFYTFLHSKQHNVYVYEQDGKLISLVNFYFHPDTDDLPIAMSGRIRPSFQGKGFGARLETSPIFSRLLTDHPKVTGVLIATLLKPNIRAKLDGQCISLYQWNFHLYNKIPDRRQLTPLLNPRPGTVDRLQPSALSYAKATEWLARNDELVEFVSRYSKRFVLVEMSWKPFPVNKSGLRQLFSFSNSFVSFGSPAGRATENEISGLSYSYCLPCKEGLFVEMHFFGDDEDVLLRHIYSDLLHYLAVADEGVRIGYGVNFSKTIDSKSVEARLLPVLGERVNSGFFSSDEAVLYINPAPRLPSKI